MRSHRADISRQIRQNVLDLIAGELRGPRSGTKNREAGNGIAPDARFGSPWMAGGKDDLPALHVGVEGIAGAKSELSPDGTGKNDLSLAGNAGLHGKNILPRRAHGEQGGRGPRQPSRSPGPRSAVMAAVELSACNSKRAVVSCGA